VDLNGDERTLRICLRVRGQRGEKEDVLKEESGGDTFPVEEGNLVEDSEGQSEPTQVVHRQRKRADRPEDVLSHTTEIGMEVQELQLFS